MGNAILTKDLIDMEIKEFERGVFEPTLRIDCRVCKYMDEREEFYIKEFRALFSEKSFQEEYEATDGLCRVHLRKVIRSLKESELSCFLFTAQVMHLKLLKLQLETFISKIRSTSRDMGDEKNSWWIAIEKCVGKKGLRS